jgi:hypothetical protein
VEAMQKLAELRDAVWSSDDIDDALKDIEKLALKYGLFDEPPSDMG